MQITWEKKSELTLTRIWSEICLIFVKKKKNLPKNKILKNRFYILCVKLEISQKILILGMKYDQFFSLCDIHYIVFLYTILRNKGSLFLSGRG